MQEVDDNLSVCVDEHSPCGLSLTGDINFLWSKGLLLLPKFNNSSPSVTRDKEICHVIMS